MAGKTGETLEIDHDENEMNKFQGFAQHDGERIAPVAKTPAAVEKPQTAAQKAKAETAAAKAKPAAAEADEDDDDAAAAPAVEKPAKSAQDRINKAVGRQRAAERERDALSARMTALEARLAAGTAAAPAAAQTPAQKAQQPAVAADPNDPEPDVSKFEFGEADIGYIKAMARWEVRQEMRAAKAAEKHTQQTEQLTAAQIETQKQFDKFFAKGAELFGDDFESAVRDEGLKLSKPLVELMLDSEHGVEIAYDLANDAELGAKVSAMSQVRQAAWFGSYEDANYSSDTAGATEDEDEDDTVVVKPTVKPEKPISRAPKPPTHKNRGGGKSETADAATSDFAAFERMAKAQG